jgi:hypothetical protein
MVRRSVSSTLSAGMMTTIFLSGIIEFGARRSTFARGTLTLRPAHGQVHLTVPGPPYVATAQ